MAGPFEYAVSFRVTHPSLKADDIAAAVGLVPKFSWTVGEQRKTPKGNPLNGVRDASYCCFDVASGTDGLLADSLGRTICSLRNRKAALDELRSTGGSLMLYCFWHSAGDTGEVFEPDLLAGLADLGVRLGLNVMDGV